MTYPTKSTVSDNDLITILDSDDSYSLKFVTYSNFFYPNKSLEFYYTVSQNLTRSWGTGGDSQQKFTIAYWYKINTFNDQASQSPFAFGNLNLSDRVRMIIDNGSISFYAETGGTNDAELVVSNTFVDSEWHHVCLSADTTQSVSSDRIKLYIDGVEMTNFTSSLYPSQNYNFNINNGDYPYYIASEGTMRYWNGLFDEFYYIDGLQLAPSSFVINNQPIVYTGAFGTKGFYLSFNDKTSLTTLGNDNSGNGNNWVLNNMTLGNSSNDSPWKY